MPAPALDYVIGILTAWLIEIPRRPRTLFYVPVRTFLWTGLGPRFYAAAFLFMALGVDHRYLVGLVIGRLLVFALYKKSRLLLGGLILQWLVPVLLFALAIRLLSLTTTHNQEGWVIPLTLWFSTAGTAWAIPRGKRLSWQGYREFPYPRTTPPELLPLHTMQQGPLYDILPGQNPLRGLIMWLAGWLCCMSSLGTTFLAAHHFWTTANSPTKPFFFLLSWAGVGAFNQSRKLLLRGRRHFKLPVSSPSSLYPGSYVLYLRSFEDDKMRAALQRPFSPPGMPMDAFGGVVGLVMSSRDEEEHIADALRPVGPMVAVGAPGEVLPFAGATRMYMPRTVWKQPVRSLMQRARLVTLTLGPSAGTMWELSEALRILPPQRLLLLVPGTMREHEYSNIRSHTERTLRALPESEGNETWVNNAPPRLPGYKELHLPEMGLIHFSADWEPTFSLTSHRDPPWSNLCTRLIPKLRPAFDRLAAYEEKTGRHCG